MLSSQLAMTMAWTSSENGEKWLYPEDRAKRTAYVNKCGIQENFKVFILSKWQECVSNTSKVIRAIDLKAQRFSFRLNQWLLDIAMEVPVIS